MYMARLLWKCGALLHRTGQVEAATGKEMNVQVIKADKDRMAVIGHFAHFYIYGLSETMDWDCSVILQSGAGLMEHDLVEYDGS
jgi:urease beta subunit